MDHKRIAGLSDGLLTSSGNLNLPHLREVLSRGYVPEHSAWFMRAMSCGEPLLVDDHFFLAGQDWLMAIGYPLEGSYDSRKFESALEHCKRRIQPSGCFSVSPEFPPSLSSKVLERDHYYILHTNSTVQPRVLRLAGRASEVLRVEQGRVFTSAHQALWEEFVCARTLPPRVRSMYNRTSSVVCAVQDLILLNAWDRNDRLAACLLLDFGPDRFASYLIGAQSRQYYTPYAMDLLFREMLELARQKKKEFIHLGLGVNQGIKRFKVKWGGVAAWPYQYAAWEEEGSGGKNQVQALELQALFGDKFEYMRTLPQQRKLAMLWELKKDGRKSWIAGAAHFCRFSFENHMRRLFQEVDTVLCEGPLDRVNMDLISERGKNPGPADPRAASMLSESEIEGLQKVVQGTTGFWAQLLNLAGRDKVDVRYYLEHTRPWLACFALWSSFLKRHGWNQSVDMEAWNTARDMGKYVLGMETMAEQIITLESIPMQRVVLFFKNCRNWHKLKKHYEKGYIRGDLDNMFGSGIEFPSRTEMVISRRDERFLRRMLPFLERGGCAVFVGTAHMLNLRYMLREAGFSVRQFTKLGD